MKIRIIALLLALITLLTFVSCDVPINADKASPSEMSSVSPLIYDVKNPSDNSLAMLGDAIESIIGLQNEKFVISELRIYHITYEQLASYAALSAEMTFEEFFGYRVCDLNACFGYGSAISFYQNEATLAATIRPIDDNFALIDSEEMDWNSFMAKMAIGCGIIIISAIVAPFTGGTFSCALMATAKIALSEAAISAASVAVIETIGGLINGQTLSESVGQALSSKNFFNAFADGFMIGALVGSAVTLTTPVCFPSGTPVVLGDGSTAQIQDIVPGDTVMSYDTESDSFSPRTVTRVFENTSPSLIKVVTESGEIYCTPEHPFYIEGNWIAARDLKKGHIALNVDGGETEILESVCIALDEPVKVYNIEVSDYHTFFAGDAGILVHNSCKPGDGMFEIDTYKNLKMRRKENPAAYRGLEAHHLPSKAFLKEWGISADDGIAIYISSKSSHSKTFTYRGWSKQKEKFYRALSPEEALRLDLSNTRAILNEEGLLTDTLRKNLDEIYEIYKKSYPHIFS